MHIGRFYIKTMKKNNYLILILIKLNNDKKKEKIALFKIDA